MGGRERDVEIEGFAPGVRVCTPSGRLGTVLKHQGAQSKFDPFVRVVVQLDGGSRHDVVTLQPQLLRRCATPERSSAAPACQTLLLPWPPTALSPNARQHWAQLARAKARYREACAWTAASQGLRALSPGCRPHLTLTFVPPTRRPYDLDNALARIKAGLDGLADTLRCDDRYWTLTIQKGEGIGGFVRVEVRV